MRRVDPFGLFDEEEVLPGAPSLPSATPGSAIPPQFGPPVALNQLVPAYAQLATTYMQVSAMGMSCVVGLGPVALVATSATTRNWFFASTLQLIGNQFLPVKNVAPGLGSAAPASQASVVKQVMNATSNAVKASKNRPAACCAASPPP
jgi:hypothetical protein